MRTIYVTKYALTAGIQMMEAEDHNADYANMATVRGNQADDSKPTVYTQYFHRPDWHETREAAVGRANKMVEAKLASLAKAVAKMKKLTFE